MTQSHNIVYLIKLLLFIVACHINVVTKSFGATEAEILIIFKNSLSNDSALYNWNASVSPCNGNKPNWIGLRCNNDSTLDKLVLEDMGLMGAIDIDALVLLPTLRTLSIMNNSFEGKIPQVKKLTSLRNLYLSNNHFSAEIPEDAFREMNSLREVFLAHNEFVGDIPTSLVELPKLTKLSLEGNQLGGKIPDFRQNFSVFNVAYNHLKGRIPAGLEYINPSSFTGNEGLCGKPLPECKSSNKKKTVITIVVVVASVVALGIIVAVAYIRSSLTKTAQFNTTEAQQKFGMSLDLGKVKEAGSLDQLGGHHENGRLHFVRYDRDRFDLQDLLRASAEVLGSGTFGSSYKAILLNGPAMVVKRFRRMNRLGKEEFHAHMNRLGMLSHPNLLPLVAFYYTKGENLLVSNFIDNGSLANHLHAKRASGQARLDWPTRLKIIKGVAKGLAYLYKEFPSLTVPHGHLKSSNVLLDDTFQPLLTEYALVPVVSEEHAQQVMVAYKSPEFNQSNRTTRKTDVWSLGILILEMLTGKFPANYLRQGQGADRDLATWVNSVVREEWTGEVFDKDMKGTRNGESEMLKLLKIGMCCCEWNVDRRWDLNDAVVKIEELKERDNNDNIDDFSSYASEGEIYSSRALTENGFSFSVNG